MPKFGVDVTNIAPAQVKPFIAPGVETQTPTINAGVAQAQLIGQLGQTAIEAYKGYQLADLEQEQEKNIADYMAAKQNPAIANQAEIDAATQRETIDKLWDNFDAEIEDVNPIEKSFQQNLLKYKTAAEQGIISPEELNARVLKTTREAVAKNPGLYNELLQHSQRVLELSGIQQVVKADQALVESQQKQQQKMLDNIVQIAKEKNVSVNYNPDGSIANLGQVKQQIDYIQAQEQAAEAIKRSAGAYTDSQKLEAINFTKQFGIAGANGLINEASANAITAFNGEGNYANKISYARNLFNAVRQEIAQKTQGITHDPEVQAVMDYTEKQLKAIEDNLTAFTSGEDAAKFLENSVKMLRSEGYIRVTQQTGMDPDTLRTVSGFMQGVLGNRVIQQNPKLANQLVDTIANMAKGVISLGTDITTLGAGKTPAVVDAVGYAASKSGAGDSGATKVLDNLISTTASELQNPEKFAPTIEGTSAKFKFYDSYIRKLAEDGSKEGLRNINDTSRAAASGNLAEYMDLTMRDMHKQILAAEANGVGVKWVNLPDGRIAVETSDPAFTKLLTQNYVSRINWGLGAFANLQGVDKKQAAPNFYGNYKEYFGISEGRVSQQEIVGKIKQGSSQPKGEFVYKSSKDVTKIMNDITKIADPAEREAALKAFLQQLESAQ